MKNIYVFLKKLTVSPYSWKLVHLLFCCVLIFPITEARAAADPVTSRLPAESSVFPVSDVLPDDGSGMALLDETVKAVIMANKTAIARLEKKLGRKMTPDDSDDLDPEKEYMPLFTAAYKKAKGTAAELLMLYWIVEKNLFSNEKTYPAILKAWKNFPNRWEAILLYADGLLTSESNRSGRIAQPSERRALLHWVILENRKLLAHMQTLNPEIWKNSKMLVWWFEREKKRYGSGPGAPTKPEHVLPSYAWAVSGCIYTELNFVSEKLCTALEAGQILGQIRSSCEDALRKEAGYINADQLRDFLKDRLPAVEKELAEHPELWPKELPKWDGKPSWEIKIEGE